MTSRAGWIVLVAFSAAAAAPGGRRTDSHGDADCGSTDHPDSETTEDSDTDSSGSADSSGGGESASSW